MRFCVELYLKYPYFTKEKNKAIMHIFKLLFKNSNPHKFQNMYETKTNTEKNFTFSTYLGKDIKFNKEEIYVPSRKILINFSTYDISEGILFYNSFINNLGLEIPIGDNVITIHSITKTKEKEVLHNAVFSSASPVIIREHKGNNNKTWYHDITSDEGFEVLKKNLSFQLNSNLKGVLQKDIDEIEITILKNKLVKVKHYGITILSNLVIMNINAKPYIMDYLYKAGIGSRRSQGFGYLNIE